MLLLNNKDPLRKQFGIGSKSADVIVKGKNHNFAIPMAAVGETIIKIRDKQHESFIPILKELDRLLEKGFFTVSYIRSSDAF